MPTAGVTFAAADDEHPGPCGVEPTEVSRWVAHHQDIMQATPATWRLLVEAGAWPPTERFIAICGGETCPAGLARQLRTRASAAWNVYGPTETTIWSTAHRITADDADSVPIGRPLANTVCRVMDHTGAEQPIGVPGELYIGGAGVALAYLGSPDLTAEKFVSGPDPRERWFRTGDIVRWTSNGELEFLGRNDRQVKVRGFRIEPAEIESVLLEHPEVRRAAVVLADDVPAVGLRLVGYVVGPTDPEQSVRRFLTQRLPGYMVPNHLVALESLPTTPNGKTDRAALAALDFQQPTTEADEGRPTRASSRFEAELSRIWGEVLGLASVDRHRSFFESGGHSLLAMRLVLRVRNELGAEIDVDSIFDHPTVAELAALLGRDS
jgi:acyl-coenzyme A synthetase/AMP-(fatty) acid ligase/acyl carrier protein